MTREEAIAIIRNEYLCVDKDCDIGESCSECPYVMPTKEPILEAYNMAIKALEQEPCGDAISRQAVLDELNKWEWQELYLPIHFKENIIDVVPSVNPQPCDDAISRDMALEKMADYVASGYADSAEDFEEYSRIICQLPPVNPQEPKTGHWDKWYEEIKRDDKCTDYIPHCKCSECNKECDAHIIQFINYCPNCGCRMVEPQESENKE